MNILILGSSEDTHAAHLKDVLTQTGATVDYLDTRLFPTQLRMSWQPDTQAGCFVLPTGHRLDFQDIHSVFGRSVAGVHIPSLQDSAQQRIAYNASISALRSLVQSK